MHRTSKLAVCFSLLVNTALDSPCPSYPPMRPLCLAGNRNMTMQRRETTGSARRGWTRLNAWRWRCMSACKNKVGEGEDGTANWRAVKSAFSSAGFERPEVYNWTSRSELNQIQLKNRPLLIAEMTLRYWYRRIPLPLPGVTWQKTGSWERVWFWLQGNFPFQISSIHTMCYSSNTEYKI